MELAYCLYLDPVSELHLGAWRTFYTHVYSFASPFLSAGLNKPWFTEFDFVLSPALARSHVCPRGRDLTQVYTCIVAKGQSKTTVSIKDQMSEVLLRYRIHLPAP